MNSIRRQLEQLEDRAVPATLNWVGEGADTKWSTLQNWKENGAYPQAAPNENDTVKLPDTSTIADVAKVGSIRTAANNETDLAAFKLAQNLTVTSTMNVTELWIQSVAGNTRTLTVDSGGSFTIGDNLIADDVNITLGSATQHNVTATWTLNSLSAIRTTTVTNYGDLTIAGSSALSGDVATPSDFINGIGGKLSVTNPGLTFAGTMSNVGTLQFDAITISVTPAFSNVGTVQVSTGTVDFKSTAIQTGGEFQIRDATVKVSGGTQTLAIADGALTGVGSIDANVTMGLASEIGGPLSSPTLSPGLGDPDDPTAMATGTIAITKDFTILSTSGTANFEVKNDGTTDQVTVGGTATVRGTANISASSAYQPPAGTQLKLITATTALTGTFGTVNIARTPLTWEHTLNPNRPHSWASLYFQDGKSFGIQVQLGALVRDQGSD